MKTTTPSGSQSQLVAVAASTKGAVTVGSSTLSMTRIVKQLDTVRKSSWRPQSSPS